MPRSNAETQLAEQGVPRAVAQTEALIVVGSQAVVFSELELQQALLAHDVAVINVARSFALSADLWPPEALAVRRSVVIKRWPQNVDLVTVNASVASRQSVSCVDASCIIQLLGPGLAWVNPTVPGDPLVDFITPVPMLFQLKANGTLLLDGLTVISATPTGIWNPNHLVLQPNSTWAGNLSLTCESPTSIRVDWVSYNQDRWDFTNPTEPAVLIGAIIMASVRMQLAPAYACGPRFTQQACEAVAQVCAGPKGRHPLAPGACSAANRTAACSPEPEDYPIGPGDGSFSGGTDPPSSDPPVQTPAPAPETNGSGSVPWNKEGMPGSPITDVGTGPSVATPADGGAEARASNRHWVGIVAGLSAALTVAAIAIATWRVAAVRRRVAAARGQPSTDGSDSSTGKDAAMVLAPRDESVLGVHNGSPDSDATDGAAGLVVLQLGPDASTGTWGDVARTPTSSVCHSATTAPPPLPLALTPTASAPRLFTIHGGDGGPPQPTSPFCVYGNPAADQSIPLETGPDGGTEFSFQSDVLDGRGSSCAVGRSVIINLVPACGTPVLAGNPLGVRIEGLMGTGSYGVVYRGTWQGQHVAIKVIKHQITEQADLDVLLEFREAAVGAELHHPRIVSTLAHALVLPEGLCDDVGRLLRSGPVEAHIVSALCDMGTLKAWLQEARASRIGPGGVASSRRAPPSVMSLDLSTLAPPGSPAMRSVPGSTSVADMSLTAGLPAEGMLLMPLSPASTSSRAMSLLPEAPLLPPLACMPPYGAAGVRVHTDFNAHLVAVIDILLEVVDVLSYLFGKGVVHGDLKPQNCLRCSDSQESLRGFRIKVCDFGISRVIHGSRSHTTVSHPPGTLAYFAPELLNSCRLSPSCDLYSFGIMMHELLACRQPLSGLTMAQVLYRKATGTVDELMTYPTGTPRPYATLARACYSMDAKHRPALPEVAAGLLAIRETALREWHVPGTVPPPPPPTVTLPPAPRTVIVRRSASAPDIRRPPPAAGRNEEGEEETQHDSDEGAAAAASGAPEAPWGPADAKLSRSHSIGS